MKIVIEFDTVCLGPREAAILRSLSEAVDPEWETRSGVPLEVVPEDFVFRVGHPAIEAPPVPESPIEAPVETKVTKRPRRTKAEIDAETDAAVEVALIDAFQKGADPVLPAAIAKRVGPNPKSWIDPARYEELKKLHTPAPVPTNDKPESLIAPPPDDPMDFSDVLNERVATGGPMAINKMRVDLGNKMMLLRNEDQAACAVIVNKYGATKPSAVPDEMLGEVIQAVEAALDTCEVKYQ